MLLNHILPVMLILAQLPWKVEVICLEQQTALGGFSRKVMLNRCQTKRLLLQLKLLCVLLVRFFPKLYHTEPRKPRLEWTGVWINHHSPHMRGNINKSFQVLSLKGTARPFYSETVLFRHVLELILPQNNHCLLPHYCCTKFCFCWILWLRQMFAWSGTDPFPTSLIAFYSWLYHNEVWGFWAEMISLSPSSSSPPSCGATFGYGQCCRFCFYGWNKRHAAVRETPSEPCIDISVCKLAQGRHVL